MIRGQEYTINEAALRLEVSRPFFIHNLLEAGIIPFHLVGNHRRIYLADLLAYQQEKKRQHALLDEIARETQEMGLY